MIVGVGGRSHVCIIFELTILNATLSAFETNYTIPLTGKVVFLILLSQPLPSASGQTRLSYVLFFFSSFNGLKLSTGNYMIVAGITTLLCICYSQRSFDLI